MEKILISFFQRVAKKDEYEIEKLNQNGNFRFETNCWYFTLPNLFTYLQQQNELSQEIEYKQFRQQLFNCSINQKIKELGSEMVINNNKYKVDESEYTLVWKLKI